MEIMVLVLLVALASAYIGYAYRDYLAGEKSDTEYRVYQNADGSSNVVIHHKRYDKTDEYVPLTVDDMIKLKAENIQVTDKPVRKKKTEEGH